MEIAAMVEEGKADMTAIGNKLKQKATLETGLRMAAIKTDQEVLALLTPEQRDKEQSELEKMTQQHEHSGGMSRGMKEKKEEHEDHE